MLKSLCTSFWYPGSNIGIHYLHGLCGMEGDEGHPQLFHCVRRFDRNRTLRSERLDPFPQGVDTMPEVLQAGNKGIPVVEKSHGLWSCV